MIRVINLQSPPGAFDFRADRSLKKDNASMSETRERLLRAGERLFRAQGYSGTGLKQLASEAEAPWSSMYHFFPNGKEQLAEEVIRFGGDLYEQMIRQCFAAYPDPLEAVGAMFTGEAKILRDRESTR